MSLRHCTCALLVLSAIFSAEGSVTARVASLQGVVRANEAGNLVGTYHRFDGYSLNIDFCPQTIQHTGSDGMNAVPHRAIRHDGKPCTSSGSLQRVDIRKRFRINDPAKGSFVPTNVASRLDDFLFFGRERVDRQCPSKPFPRNTVVILVQITSSNVEEARLLASSFQPGDRGLYVLSPGTNANESFFCGYSSRAFSDDAACFPAGTMVLLKDGAEKPVSELQLGDAVQVGGGEHSEVFMFTHRLADAAHEFVRLTTRVGALTATPGHYVYVNNKLTAAGAARVGDTLTRADGTPAEITRVQRVWATGLYNPQTVHGDIVVDGFRASTYTTAVEPKLADALLAPLRGIYRLGFKMDRISQLFDRGVGELAQWVPKGSREYS